MTLPLPDIHLTDLGINDEGLTPAELTKAILKAVTSATVKAVSPSVNNFGMGATEDVDKVKKGLGGLFGK
jgi:hypothetical protein